MSNVKGLGKFYAKECDVTDEEDIIESLDWITDNLGPIAVVINNAGILKISKLEGTKKIVSTNDSQIQNY